VTATYQHKREIVVSRRLS